jgi:hypothetical protein
MSSYKELKTEFRNIESLKKALADVGFGHFDLSANPKLNSLPMIGYTGRPGENVALRLPKAHYHGYEDTRFAWDAETRTYRAIISTHDGGGNFGAGTLQKLRQRYAYQEVKRQAAVKGYTVREVAGTDGVIRLQLTHR